MHKRSKRGESIDAVSAAADGLTRSCASLAARTIPSAVDHLGLSGTVVAFRKIFRASIDTPGDMLAMLRKIP